VTWLEKRKVKRPIAILIALVGVLGIFAGLVLSIIPVLVQQITNVVELVTKNVVPSVTNGTIVDDIAATLPWLDKTTVSTIVDQISDFFSNPDTIADISAGVLQVGVGIGTGTFGAIIVVILMIYFVASLSSLKRGVYRLVPASKRESFIDLAEQITASVGRYVMGQIGLALINGVLSFIVLTFIFRVENSALLAFIAFLGSLIPLVGTLSASVIIILATLLFEGAGWQLIAVAIYYLVYMQVEAYVINPRVMASAVQVPGVVVVIAALVGGTLLGVLGALIAIPVAAAIQLIMKEVIIPRQNAL